MKYEKTAREGSSKRSAGYELECVSLREERDALSTEQKINRRRVEELTTTLNQERMKRLRDLHLNEVLRKQNVALEDSARLVAADSVTANEKLLEKVLIADSAVAKSEVQRKIIDSQALEILEVTQEVTVAKEKYKQAQERIGELEIALANRTKEVLDYEKEVWRLRKEVTNLAGQSHTDQHVAFGRSYQPVSSFPLPSRRIKLEGELRELKEGFAAKGGGSVLGSASLASSAVGSSFGAEQTMIHGRHIPESSLSLLSQSLTEDLPSYSRNGRYPKVDSVSCNESVGNSSVFSGTTPFSPTRHGAFADRLIENGESTRKLQDRDSKIDFSEGM